MRTSPRTGALVVADLCARPRLWPWLCRPPLQYVLYQITSLGYVNESALAYEVRASVLFRWRLPACVRVRVRVVAREGKGQGGKGARGKGWL